VRLDGRRGGDVVRMVLEPFPSLNADIGRRDCGSAAVFFMTAPFGRREAPTKTIPLQGSGLPLGQGQTIDR
jgi:hypothetical protein